MNRSKRLIIALAVTAFSFAQNAAGIAKLAVTSGVEKLTVASGVEKLTVATWNVENLFDTVTNQQEAADAEFTPESWRRWTPARYQKKLDNLAWVINEMKPDVLCVAEVENKGVLQDLSNRILKNHGWTLPHIAHVDSPDPRGIDNAVLSRFPISDVRYLRIGGRRGTIIATVDVDGSPVTFMANHWKSQMGDRDENITIRTGEAAALRQETLKILKKNPKASVVICGDLNEDLDGACVVTGLGAVPERKDSFGTSGADTKFYNLVGDIPVKNRGSYYYARRKVWNTFDAIIVPPSMLEPSDQPGPDWRVQDAAADGTRTFALPEMKEEPDGRPKAYRRVRIKDKPANYYVEGYADHFPVITVLERAK